MALEKRCIRARTEATGQGVQRLSALAARKPLAIIVYRFEKCNSKCNVAAIFDHLAFSVAARNLWWQQVLLTSSSKTQFRYGVLTQSPESHGRLYLHNVVLPIIKANIQILQQILLATYLMTGLHCTVSL